MDYIHCKMTKTQHQTVYHYKMVKTAFSDFN